MKSGIHIAVIDLDHAPASALCGRAHCLPRQCRPKLSRPLGKTRPRSGNCGKTAEVADLQDVLLRVMQGVSAFAHRAAQMGVHDSEVDALTPYAWFTTLTNVNFDATRFMALIATALEMREKARILAVSAGADRPQPAT